MKKRVLRIGIEKDDTPPRVAGATPPEKRIDITVDHVTDAVKSVIKTVSIAAVGYVAIDTVRQVLVAKATQK